MIPLYLVDLILAIPAIAYNIYYCWHEWHRMEIGTFTVLFGGFVIPLACVYLIYVTNDPLFMILAGGINFYAVMMPGRLLALRAGMVMKESDCKERLELAERQVANFQSLFDMMATSQREREKHGKQ